MTRLAVGQPVATREPRIDIDAGLAAGTHRFRLEVIDDAGLRSRPDVAAVVVRPTVIGRPPLPVPNPVGPTTGPPVPIVRPGGPVSQPVQLATTAAQAAAAPPRPTPPLRVPGRRP